MRVGIAPKATRPGGSVKQIDVTRASHARASTCTACRVIDFAVADAANFPRRRRSATGRLLPAGCRHAHSPRSPTRSASLPTWMRRCSRSPTRSPRSIASRRSRCVRYDARREMLRRSARRRTATRVAQHAPRHDVRPPADARAHRRRGGRHVRRLRRSVRRVRRAVRASQRFSDVGLARAPRPAVRGPARGASSCCTRRASSSARAPRSGSRRPSRCSSSPIVRFLEREAREEAVRTLEDVTQRVHGEYERKLGDARAAAARGASGRSRRTPIPSALVALEREAAQRAGGRAASRRGAPTRSRRR